MRYKLSPPAARALGTAYLADAVDAYLEGIANVAAGMEDDAEPQEFVPGVERMVAGNIRRFIDTHYAALRRAGVLGRECGWLLFEPNPPYYDALAVYRMPADIACCAGDYTGATSLTTDGLIDYDMQSTTCTRRSKPQRSR